MNNVFPPISNTYANVSDLLVRLVGAYLEFENGDSAFIRKRFKI